MPRKHNAKHGRYVKPDYHSQNKKETKQPATNKNKLRTSIDIYQGLIHDQTLGIDLNYEKENDLDEKAVILHNNTLNKTTNINNTNKIKRSGRGSFGGQFRGRRPRDDRPMPMDEDMDEPRPRRGGFDRSRRGRGGFRRRGRGRGGFRGRGRGRGSPRREITLAFTTRRVFQEPRLNGKVSRNDYKLIASATKTIMKNKSFIHPKTKRRVNIAKDMEYSYENSEFYSEQHWFRYINIEKEKLRKYETMEIEINHETTLDCAYRLTSQYGTDIKIAMLNFSSARNPGGGWDTGAIAQEESIARSSTLIHAITQYETDFYEYHKQRKSMLYSHALIYSPQVVIMKHGNGVAIERGDGCYRCDVITSPAVNAKNYIKRARHTDSMMKKYGQLNKKYKGQSISSEETQAAAWNVVEHVMRERCTRVLELAMKYGNEYLILGAWGCGVFGNDSMMIARIFAELLRDRYHNVFRKVVFAILDQKKKKPLDKFINQFQKVFAKQRRQ
eukprot:631258_1